MHACIKKVTKETIVNCWKKSGLIGNSEETNEELITKVEKERSKENEELDELIKLIGREAFFKQFVHPSLKTEIKSTEDFINLEDDCESMAILTDKEIINICRKDSENETQTDFEEAVIAVTSKEAYEGFRTFSKYIEQSTIYDDQKLEMLQKCEDCIFEVKQDQMKQIRINEYFKKITLKN